MNVAIVGAGKVGSVLGKILATRGAKIVAVVSRTNASAARAGKYLRCRNVSTSLAAIPPKTDLVLIATPHSAVEEVAYKLTAIAHLEFKRLSVCHASGTLTADALVPLAKKGASVFSFHPLQTFPRDFGPAEILPTVRGIYYGVDGSKKGIAVAGVLAKKLGGKVLVVKPEMRKFYHAACVVASNHLTTMLWILEQMFGALKTNEKKFFPVFEPIMQAALRNAARTSPAKSLSGPIARGGVETVAGHFESVKKFAPELVPYFAALSAETTRLAEAKGSIEKDRAEKLFNLIRSITN
ncbi:MAG: DUF2520 domain-containing protein [Ignavibacteriae bacterium]|nr:DUF2520 domain-containing protein [Ignavibacteriota bacterium]